MIGAVVYSKRLWVNGEKVKKDTYSDFSVDKALQVLDYIQKKSNTTDKMKLLKLEYFADRYHIRTYCYPLLSDCFYAMKQGPVPSKLYDILKLENGEYSSLTQEELNEAQKHIKMLNPFSIEVEGIDKNDKLSISAIKSLDFALREFGSFTPDQLSNISHLYPEWKKFETEQNNPKMRRVMNYEDFFDDPDPASLKILSVNFGIAKDPYQDEDIAKAKEIFVEGF